MKVTYIGHSGFLVETKLANLLFDYRAGELPEINRSLPLLVFVSHIHEDHYNPAIFALAKQYKDVQYFISDDVEITEEVKKRYELTKSFMKKHIVQISAGIRRIIPLELENGEKNHIRMETIPSTDQGLAFLLNVCGQRIFHTGDLNCWVWETDSVNQVNHMKTKYKRLIERLNGRDIYLAMAPLDPRQGKYYKLSMDYLLNAAPIKYAVPMHLWEQYEYIDRYLEERRTKDLSTQILKFTVPLECKEI